MLIKVQNTCLSKEKNTCYRLSTVIQTHAGKKTDNSKQRFSEKNRHRLEMSRPETWTWNTCGLKIETSVQTHDVERRLTPQRSEAVRKIITGQKPEDRMQTHDGERRLTPQCSEAMRKIVRYRPETRRQNADTSSEKTDFKSLASLETHENECRNK